MSVSGNGHLHSSGAEGKMRRVRRSSGDVGEWGEGGWWLLGSQGTNCPQAADTLCEPSSPCTELGLERIHALLHVSSI